MKKLIEDRGMKWYPPLTLYYITEDHYNESHENESNLWSKQDQNEIIPHIIYMCIKEK